MRLGYFNVHRVLIDHPVVGVTCPNDLATFMLLLSEAAYQKRKVSVEGWVITLQRGQVTMSQREMAERMKCSVGRVQKSLKRLIRYGVATRTMTESRQHVITICNYDKYQSPGVYYDTGPESSRSLDVYDSIEEGKELNNIPTIREPEFVKQTGDFVVNHVYDIRIHNTHISRWRREFPNANLDTLLPKLAVTFNTGPGINKFREYPHLWFAPIIESEHKKATKPTDKPKESVRETMERLGVK